MKQGQYKYISPVYSYTQPYLFSYKSIVPQWARYTVPLPPAMPFIVPCLSCCRLFLCSLVILHSGTEIRKALVCGVHRHANFCPRSAPKIAPKIARSEHDMPLLSPPSHKLIALKNIKKTATTRQRHDNEKRVKAYF